MADTYTYIHDMREHTKVPENGILSQSVQSDERSKVVLFGLAAAGRRRERRGRGHLRLHAGLPGARHQGEDGRRLAADDDQEVTLISAGRPSASPERNEVDMGPSRAAAGVV
jgi:hypothetical protein